MRCFHGRNLLVKPLRGRARDQSEIIGTFCRAPFAPVRQPCYCRRVSNRTPSARSADVDRVTSLPSAPIAAGGIDLRIRRNLVAVLALVLGLTGVLLATLASTASSAPRSDTTVITPSGRTDMGVQPDRMGYDSVQPDRMGYDHAP